MGMKQFQELISFAPKTLEVLRRRPFATFDGDAHKKFIDFIEQNGSTCLNLPSQPALP